MKLLALCMATDNREAFSRLVVAHQDGLRRFILNMSDGDAILTDDIAQETFLKAWLGIRSFKGLSGFKTWLYRIAVNEFISYRRKQTAPPNIDIDTVTNIQMYSDDQHSATEAKIDIKKALGMLSDQEKMVTLLFYLEDIPIKQISKITSMPEGTIKSHLNRARTHLSEIFKDKKDENKT